MQVILSYLNQLGHGSGIGRQWLQSKLSSLKCYWQALVEESGKQYGSSETQKYQKSEVPQLIGNQSPRCILSWVPNFRCARVKFRGIKAMFNFVHHRIEWLECTVNCFSMKNLLTLCPKQYLCRLHVVFIFKEFGEHLVWLLLTSVNIFKCFFGENPQILCTIDCMHWVHIYENDDISFVDLTVDLSTESHCLSLYVTG